MLLVRGCWFEQPPASMLAATRAVATSSAHSLLACACSRRCCDCRRCCFSRGCCFCGRCCFCRGCCDCGRCGFGRGRGSRRGRSIRRSGGLFALIACSECHSCQQGCYEEGFLHDHVLLWFKGKQQRKIKPVMCSNTDLGRWWRCSFDELESSLRLGRKLYALSY
jgi:hypothetical protein